jgi:hypothetical protein
MARPLNDMNMCLGRVYAASNNTCSIFKNLVQKSSTVYLLPLIGGFQPVSLVISKVPPQMKRDKVVF